MFLILTKSCCFYPENLSAYDCFEIDEFTVQCEYVVMTSSNIWLSRENCWLSFWFIRSNLDWVLWKIGGFPL